MYYSQKLADSERRRAAAALVGSDGDGDGEEEGDDLDGRSMALLVARGGRQSDLRDKSAAEFSKLREGLLRSRRAVNVLTGGEAESVWCTCPDRPLLLLTVSHSLFFRCSCAKRRRSRR